MKFTDENGAVWEITGPIFMIRGVEYCDNVRIERIANPQPCSDDSKLQALLTGEHETPGQFGARIARESRDRHWPKVEAALKNDSPDEFAEVDRAIIELARQYIHPADGKDVGYLIADIARAIVAVAEKRTDWLRSDLEDLTGTVKVLDGMYSRLFDLCNRQQDEINSLTKRVEELEASWSPAISNHRTELEAHGDHIESLAKQLEELPPTQNIKALFDRVSSLEDWINELDKAVLNLKSAGE